MTPLEKKLGVSIMDPIPSKVEIILEISRLFAHIATLEREAEQERSARIAAEKERNHQSRALADTIHELTTPLTVILGYATSLLATDIEWSHENQTEFIIVIADE